MPDIASIEKLISQGRYSEARALSQEALKTTDEVRYSQLFALATSKSGTPKAAMDFLEPVYRMQAQDPETAGILGGIYKTIFKKDQDTKYALLSRDTYLKNFSITKNYYTGINAATMSVLAGQVGKGRELAKEVIALLTSTTPDFWETVTLAEAYLLSKEREKAIDHYFKAKKMAGTDWGKISSAYNQLWLLNHYVPVPAEVLKVFSPPGVISFVGHMIDHPSRATPRFPASIEGRVKEGITSAIKTINARIGYCSLACGSDILFAEAMAEVGGEVNVWLPFAKEDFIETSLRFAGEGWINRFESLFARFPTSFITQEAYAGYDDLFSFQSRVIMGAAVIRGSMNYTKPTLLTVLSETDLNQKEGGTRETVSVWPYSDRHININPDGFVDQQEATHITSPPQIVAKILNRPLLYLVCADLSDTPDEEQRKIWKEVLEKIGSPAVKPVTLEAHEMLVASFQSILGAMDFLNGILKVMKLFHVGTRLRTSLYASPAFIEPNPEGPGKVLTMASRERIKRFQSLVPPGNVYAFARFSSVLALDVNQYALDYAGIIAPVGEPHPFEIFTVRKNLK